MRFSKLLAALIGWESSLSRFEFIKTTNELKVIINKMIKNDLLDSELVNRAWITQTEKRIDLHNGKVLFFSRQEGEFLEAYEGEYKHWFVKHHRLLEGHSQNNMYILAVTGIINDGNTVLLGERSQFVSQNKGNYDLLPSGSLDVASNGDYLSQLKKEFKEELKHTKRLQYISNVLGLLFDNQDNVVDIIVDMKFKDGIEEFQINNSEYRSLVLMDISNNLMNINWDNVSNSTEFLLKSLSRQELI